MSILAYIKIALSTRDFVKLEKGGSVQKENIRMRSALYYGRQHDLTIDEIRACEWFRDLSDEEAMDMAETIRRFTEIMYHSYIRKQQKEKER